MTVVSKVLKGSGSNVIRLVFTSVAAVILPPVLTRTLPAADYSAWVTLLQISTYVGLLDIGLQTVVSRYVAEFHSRGDHAAAMRVITTASRLLGLAALIGVAATVVAVVQLPAIFPQMPVALRSQAQLALLLIGASSALLLPFGPYMSAFNGLQSYGFPAVVVVVTRLVSAAAIAAAALLGGGLVAMAVAAAAVNVLTVAVQWLGFRRFAWAGLSGLAAAADRSTARLLLTNGSVIALWMLSGVLVSGVDTVVVGHFDFSSAGAFALVVVLINFMLSVLGGVFGPLMPAFAAMQGPGSEREVAALVLRASRYGTLAAVAIAVLLAVFAYPILLMWVGPEYAAIGAPLLRVLVVGHAIRQLGYVYSMAVIAKGKQVPASVATLSESVVNFAASILLAQALGAVGVALGTIIGAVVSVGLHFLVSMRFTGQEIPLRRAMLLCSGILQPAAALAPMALVIPSFHPEAPVPAAIPALVAGLALSAVAVLVLGLPAPGRRALLQRASSAGRRLRPTSNTE